MNEVVSPHTAVLNGQMTALAGCSNHACEARELCLRASGCLAFRIMPKRHLKTGFDCPYFVSVDDTPTNLAVFPMSDRARWGRQLT